ncbi:RUSC1 protein, partial [Polyodon spathula]|nr:RUSC1 protein [Polyodon spathula]
MLSSALLDNRKWAGKEEPEKQERREANGNAAPGATSTGKKTRPETTKEDNNNNRNHSAGDLERRREEVRSPGTCRHHEENGNGDGICESEVDANCNDPSLQCRPETTKEDNNNNRNHSAGDLERRREEVRSPGTCRHHEENGNGDGICEPEVDANCNDPSLQCRCCREHSPPGEPGKKTPPETTLDERGGQEQSVSAVEEILSHFSSSRTLVQKVSGGTGEGEGETGEKAQSGDSRLNPSLARLVLQALCPALRSLLSDGLKPYQSDLIVGRRRNSPWGLVEASTRPDVLTAHYSPASFLRLTSCQPLFEELLLLLQPLSILTFHLDLLFEHHHLLPANQESCRASSANQIPRGSASANRGPDGKGTANQDSPGLANGNEPIDQGPKLGTANPAPGGQALQSGWKQIVQWGGGLGQNWAGPDQASRTKAGEGEGSCCTETQSGTSPDTCGTDAEATPPGGSGAGQRAPAGSEVKGAQFWMLGRLFGASLGDRKPATQEQKLRRPSSWLSPSASVPRAVRTGAAAQRGGEGSGPETSPKRTNAQNPGLRAVRTLCDYQGSGAELSFRKGEELPLVGAVDEECIRCRQGDREGLVPIGFASLIM